MARNKLTETRCKALEAPGVYGDGDGLWLRVQKGGSKNWVFIFRRGLERTEIGLGGYGQGTAPVSLALARIKAEELRQRLARGEPARPDAASKVVTFADAMESLLAIKENEWRNVKHGAQWRMTLRIYGKPLHAIPIDKVSKTDVIDCLRPHWTARPETAERLRSRIAAVLDWARAAELRTGDNPADWKGNLDKLLPRRQKLSRGHHAALGYEDMPAAMLGLRAAKSVSARAVEFACLTAARSGEVRGAVWAEFDLPKALWIVPAERMKAGVEHRVPLSARVVEILAAQRQRSVDDLVFSGAKAGQPISDTAMTKALRSASPDKTVTLHGLRSTFRDWAGDKTTHPRDVAEAALAHVIQGVEAAYRRSDALAKRRLLMEDWTVYCGGEANG